VLAPSDGSIDSLRPLAQVRTKTLIDVVTMLNLQAPEAALFDRAGSLKFDRPMVGSFSFLDNFCQICLCLQVPMGCKPNSSLSSAVFVACLYSCHLALFF
jgi:hypothetical protein